MKESRKLRLGKVFWVWCRLRYSLRWFCAEIENKHINVSILNRSNQDESITHSHNSMVPQQKNQTRIRFSNYSGQPVRNENIIILHKDLHCTLWKKTQSMKIVIVNVRSHLSNCMVSHYRLFLLKSHRKSHDMTPKWSEFLEKYRSTFKPIEVCVL